MTENNKKEGMNMFCRNCGNEMNENAAVCIKCGFARGTGNSYCPNCGKETGPNAAFCVNCGCALTAIPTNERPRHEPQPASVDEGNIGWGVLGFFIPIVGLILFIVWHDSKPKSAKLAGKGALISFVIGIALYILLIILAVVLAV